MSWLQRQHTSDDADVISDRWQMAEGAKKYSSTAAHPTGLTICYIIIFLEQCHRTLKQRFIPAKLLLTKHQASILWTGYQLDYSQRIWNENVTCTREKQRKGQMKQLSCHACPRNQTTQKDLYCLKKDINYAVPPWLLLHTTEARLHKFVSTGTHGTK